MLLLALSTLVAHGHAGAQLTAIDVAEGGDVVEASFGNVIDADGVRRWVCHEAVTSPDALLTPRYERSAPGVWLARVSSLSQVRDPGETLYRSEDACEWLAVSGLTGREVSATAFLPDRPQVALAGTATLGEEADNGIFRSVDGGRTFAPTLLQSDRLVLSLVAPGDGRVWATTTDAGGRSAWLHQSGDGGETWTARAVPIADYTDETVAVRVLAATGEAVWVVVAPTAGDTLLRSDDGGASWRQVLAVDGNLVDGGVAGDGTVWMLEGVKRLHRSADGEGFEPVDTDLVGVGLEVGDDDVLLAANAQFTGMLVGRVSAEGAVEVVLAPRDVAGPLPCPDGTEGADVCEPLWEALGPRLAGPTGDTGTDETGTDDGAGPRCGCAAAPGAGWVVLLAIAGLSRRRR